MGILALTLALFSIDIEEFEIESQNIITYDLMGRIIQKPTQGFYIQGGKKYFKIK